jgi:hypothetical protein
MPSRTPRLAISIEFLLGTPSLAATGATWSVVRRRGGDHRIGRLKGRRKQKQTGRL